ncbi:methyltransferase domain-containing protein [Streptomyces sp. R302]|uniref:methyltransferase domain-containing protein n=1 Tax=unclassified Streptomyces TaxID=2593676 RepID=UPI00145E1E79|nr:methyltransferase domain-containing protein [Streptomyces sp. R301]NML83822.1 methyltransferase domain-containing protein [Streptomyces sp. R302]
MNLAPLQHRSAAFWDSIYEPHDTIYQPIPREERLLLQERAGAALGQRAIDVGTGLGEWACQMAQIGLNVTGYDCSPVAINRAHEFHREHGGKLHFEVHDFDADPIPPHLHTGSVDVVSCRHVLQFLELPRFIADVRRWLHRDGVLHVVTAVTEKTPGGNLGMPEEQIRALATGWREHDRYDLTSDSSSTVLVLRGPWG